ncbi:MAG: aspartate kinase [Cytophagales bacterium]|uniref:aspartate kinase n=1 Tax=Cyclobacterium marinum TaxID=104 RepID=UPI0011ED82D7|nr:aspartate kinase [Cyclobacterium marinum]MBI0401626.1 aspartate kinase [Cyclobacterium marinum]MBR9776398.1 aspartate kinase [Cytophagales bacterium]|tara:strand:+ start:77403 stop:78728 length:1326 start_codon:yes stop_codon:yes gene_type:complete
MKIMKFGGTSVGRPERMHQVKDLITLDNEKKIVVLSALSGTTNALVAIGESLSSGKKEEAKEKIQSLHEHYIQFHQDLLSTEAGKAKALQIINEHFEFLNIILKISFNEAINKDILAQGELLSTKLFYTLLQENEVPAVFLPALEFMCIDENDEPNLGRIGEKLKAILASYPNETVFITQGYICKNHLNEVDNLKRGGSDYTASLIGSVLSASVVEIWTDIDGMHNNDPRVVDQTRPIAQLSFDEAAELAYFGAKILHPASIWPAQSHNVPVKLLNTMEPSAQGTTITGEGEGSVGVKAIAAKDGITAIKIKSSRMLLAHGFLRKVFEIFEKYKTSIDMITTSEVAISLTLDDITHLKEITAELQKLGKVEVDHYLSIICIVGNSIMEEKQVLNKIIDSVEEFPLRMVSYGGSKHNVSLLVDGKHKNQALQCLNNGLFDFK